MKLHNFTKSTYQAKAVAGKAFTAHGCDSLATFQGTQPGRFIEQPEGYEPCKPGFRYYQTNDGQMFGVSLD